jgi:hypothetical protein
MRGDFLEEPRTLEGSKFPANQFQSAAYLFAWNGDLPDKRRVQRKLRGCWPVSRVAQGPWERSATHFAWLTHAILARGWTDASYTMDNMLLAAHDLGCKCALRESWWHRATSRPPMELFDRPHLSVRPTDRPRTAQAPSRCYLIHFTKTRSLWSERASERTGWPAHALLYICSFLFVFSLSAAPQLSSSLHFCFLQRATARKREKTMRC